MLDDDLFTTAYDPASVTRPNVPSTLGTTHTPSVLSSVSNAKSAEAQTPSAVFPTPFPYAPHPGQNSLNPHMSMSMASSSYQPSVISDGKSTDGKSAGGLSSAVDSSTSYSGEGSSAMYYPLVVANPSTLPPGAAAASSSSHAATMATFHPAPPMPSIPAVVQHQDAGRVPDEVPPAYKDSWNSGGAT